MGEGRSAKRRRNTSLVREQQRTLLVWSGSSNHRKSLCRGRGHPPFFSDTKLDKPYKRTRISDDADAQHKKHAYLDLLTAALPFVRCIPLH